MKLTDYIAKFLAKQGVECMFVFTGGAISHLLDSVFKVNLLKGKLKPICVMHEQAGSMAADGYARATGKIGAAAVTSGPGSTNLLTGIACSYYDSIPGIYFTGQVRTWEYKGKSKQRQVGFQETDIVSMVKPITKYATMITKPEDIRYELEKAFWLAETGRPGPVLIDLPMDIQWAQVKPSKLRSYKPEGKEKDDHNDLKKVKQIAALLRKAKRAAVISGGGIRNAEAIKELKDFAALINIPVTVTFGGKDTFSHDNPLFAGLIGMLGNYSANSSLEKCDLVLAIGSRLSWRQIKSKPKEFLPKSKLVHVEIDPKELNQRVKADIAFGCDAKRFLSLLTAEIKKGKRPNFLKWAKETRQSYKKNPFCKPEYYLEKEGINPYVFMKALSKEMAEDDILVADAGQNVLWAMQAIEIRGQQRLFTAHAHSPMGYSLPAAMGPATIYKGSPRVICTIGDGGFQLNIQELQTIKNYHLPIKIFIMNNYAYGAIMDYQDGNLGGRYFASSSEHGYSIPDLLAISRAYKIKTDEINSQDNLADKIRSVLNNKGPIVCNVNLTPRTYVTVDV